MPDETQEKLIAVKFARLPRRIFDHGRKEEIWQRVHASIMLSRSNEKTSPSLKRTSGLFLLRAWFSKLAFVSLVIVLTVAVVGGTANAMPGDTLYTVKKAAENVEKALATNDEAKVKVAVKHAKRRLEEVKILVQENRGTAIVSQTLDDFKTSTEVAVAVTESKPELADHIASLGISEDEVLAEVANEEQGEAKTLVQDVLSQTKESIDKATAAAAAATNETNGEKIEGTTLMGGTATSTASSTEATTSASSKPKTSLGGKIQGDAHLNNPTTLDENPGTAEEKDPEILPQPSL